MTLDLDMSPEVQATKEKIHKLVFIKIQNFFCVKVNYQKSEKSIHRMGKKIFANHVSDKVE